jgi:RNA polymerase sigma factor (sigma-70 family)
MDTGTEINQSNFDLLLDWLDKDRKFAAQKYESIRLRLTKIFYARGCHLAEELTDETIERVTKKVATIAETYEGDPAIYFYAVAKNVFLEWTRKPKTEELPIKISNKEIKTDEAELRDRCLSKCMENISAKQSKFIIEYYNRDKRQKIALRKKLAEELGVTQEAMRVRAFRIRAILQKCVLECVANA